MKTNVIKQGIQFTLLILLVVFTQGCETEIPPEDPTPPIFSFRITGDGFDHTFTEDSDFENIELRLKRETEYDFTFIGSDAGGVERIQWIYSSSSRIRTEIPATSPWVYTATSSTSPTLSWFGDENNPLTGSVLTGTFTTHYTSTYGNFKFNVADFGGERRDANYILKRLNIYTGVHNTRIKNL